MSDLVNVLRSHLVSFATMDAAAARIEALEKHKRLQMEDIMDLGAQLGQARLRIEQLQSALRIIAGYEQCIDNLMSNQNIAIAALDQSSPPSATE